MSRYGRKRDANERRIIDALRAAGCYVQQLDGPGVPDLLVQCRGALTLVEVKEPSTLEGLAHRRSRAPGMSELTDAQVRFWTSWGDPKPSIVHNENEALAAVGVSAVVGTRPSDRQPR